MLRRFRNALREQGFVSLCFKGLAAITQKMTGGRLRVVWYLLVAQPVRNDWRVPAKMGRAIVTRMLSPEDPLLVQAPRPSAVIASRFAQHAVCIAAERSGRLLGFLWLCPAQYVEDDVRCVFVLPSSGEVWWDFDVWIQPDERNGVVFAKLWQAAHEYLRQTNSRWTCSRITRLNAASIAAHRRLGATRVGDAFFLCGRQWQVTIARRPFIQFSRGAAAMPQLHVCPPDGSIIKPATIRPTPHGHP